MGERARGRERDGAFWHLNYISIASDTREEWRKERKKEGGREGGGTANHHLDVYFNFTVFGWHLKNSNLCACDMCSLNMAARKERAEKWYSCYLTSATNAGGIWFGMQLFKNRNFKSFLSHTAVYKYHTWGLTKGTLQSDKHDSRLWRLTPGRWRRGDIWHHLYHARQGSFVLIPQKKHFSFVSSAEVHRFMWRRRTIKAKGVKNEPPSIHLSRRHFHPLSHLIIPLQALLSYF